MPKDRENLKRWIRERRQAREQQLKDYLGNKCSVCNTDENLYIVKMKHFRVFDNYSGLHNYLTTNQIDFDAERDCFSLFCGKHIPADKKATNQGVLKSKKRAIIVEGIKYESIRAAARAHNTSIYDIKQRGEICE